MNNPPQNQPFPHAQPCAPQRIQNVKIILDRKMFFQQQMVAMFGAARMGEIFASNEPFILPLTLHENSFDVYIYILPN